MTLEWTKIYDNDDLEVYAARNDRHASLAITFDYSAVPGRPPHIPAANFFEDIGFDQVHITSKRDIWYQTPELVPVAELVRGIRRSYDLAISYGNSMGAYGALLTSGLVDADKVLAFAPQFSVNLAQIPEETRWLHATKDLVFLHDDMSALLSPRAVKYIVYDPFWFEDVRHVACFVGTPNLRPVRVPLCGHFPASYLFHLGLLSKFMNAMIFGVSIGPDLRTELRAARKRSPLYYSNLAQVLGRAKRSEVAVRAAQIAYALAPDAPESLVGLAALGAFDPKHMLMAHMALRLLKILHPNYGDYDGMRDDVLARLKATLAR